MIRYHEQCPDGVVGEDGAGEDEHCEAYEAVELWWIDLVSFWSGLLVEVLDVLGCWRPWWIVSMKSWCSSVCSSEEVFLSKHDCLMFQSKLPSITPQIMSSRVSTMEVRDQLAVKPLGIYPGFPCDRPTVCHYSTIE